MKALFWCDNPLLVSELKGLLEKEAGVVVYKVHTGSKAPVPEPGTDMLIICLEKIGAILKKVSNLQKIRASPIRVVMFVSGPISADEILYSANGGVQSFLSMRDGPSEIAQGLEAVRFGKYHLSSKINSGENKIEYLTRLSKKGRERERDGNLNELTGRELQVFRMIAEGGGSLKEIADILGLSPKTVEAHKVSVMDKLNIRNLTGLVKFAHEEQLQLSN